MQPYNTTPTKICPKCGETKPATTEYYSRDKRSTDGLQSQCKTCNRAYHAANKKRRAEYNRAYRAANKERIAENGRAYYRANRERKAEYDRIYRITHKERYRQSRRVYYAANKERFKTYRFANRERRLEQNHIWREANKEHIKAYRIANREMGRNHVNLRRARKCKAEGAYTTADIKAQYKRQKGKCYWCGVRVGEKYHIDHIVPLSRGGSNWPENLVVTCPACNCSKRDKLPHEWIEGGKLL